MSVSGTKNQPGDVLGLYWTQLVVMLRRNTILQIRYASSTIAQTLVAPLVFHLILFILQQADYANQRKSNPHPPVGALDGLSPCVDSSTAGPCTFMFYYPNTPEITQLMTTFASINSDRMGTTFKVDATQNLTDAYTPSSSAKTTIYPVPSVDFIYNYARNNPNRTRWAVTWDIVRTPTVNYRYQLWFNATLSANKSDIFGREIISAVRGIDEAIITVSTGGSKKANLDYQLKDWPLIPAVTVSDGIVQGLGPCFFFCSVMVIFISLLNQIVSEKEAKLRHGMEMMGLKPCIYWISNYISISILVLINSLLTVVFGIMLQFSAFTQTNFFVLWITFFLFGESMVMLAFCLTTLVRKAKSAVQIGMFFFINGLLFESFVFSNSTFGYMWWAAGVTSPTTGQVLAIFIPFFNFGHMFLDITTYTTGSRDSLTETYIPGPGFSWSTLYDPLPQNLLPSYNIGNTTINPIVPPPIDAWKYMLLNCVVYGILTWFLDAVICDEYGNGRYPWFFLLPSYWGYSNGSKMVVSTWLDNVIKEQGHVVIEDEGEDVKSERMKALNPNDNGAVKIVNLHKRYNRSKVAVQNTTLSLPEGKLLALLGQNGAGKSTTMSILAGLVPPTKGDALIYGLSVKSQMSRIRSLLGVCPQHDILFNDLTAKEHIELYAGLKGVRHEDLPELYENRLEAVKLSTVRNVRSGTYSGGMKRRLSLVIATIGDPRVVFLDEPTTGMDPVNRRHVWKFIEQFKRDRVIVLTTHSMEEADVLADSIAIMAHGQLRAIGNAITLKTKHGAGYRISVITDSSNEMKQIVSNQVPDAKLEDDSAGALIYQFPVSSTPYIPAFVKWLEEKQKVQDGLVKAWGISQTTLEEVFLKLIRDANPDGYVATKNG